MIDLDGIRKRDAEELRAPMSEAELDRRALLAYVDALREAARQVTCWCCALESGTPNELLQPTCNDCSALRALLNPQKQEPTNG